MIKQIEELREFIKDNNRNTEHQQDIIFLQDEVCGSLAAGTHGAGGHLIKVIQWGRQMQHEKTSRAWDGSQISSTLTANNAGGGQRMPDKENFNAVITPDERKEDMDNDYVVRRLTPLECERLQGFPDGWTDTPGASDTARYKALGNSIALPQWQIIIDNMKQYLPDGATLGSLFDGIGGFPLCWERTHGKGTAKWASEIEKFPIEVTKYHFGEE